jgi:hypothetical protein
MVRTVLNESNQSMTLFGKFPLVSPFRQVITGANSKSVSKVQMQMQMKKLQTVTPKRA